MVASSSRFKFDVLTRAVDGVQERTICGAIVTLISIVVIGMLLLVEIRSYWSGTLVHQIGVDDGWFGKERWTVPDRIPIQIYMTFAHIHCDVLILEIDSTRSNFEPINEVIFRIPTNDELNWVGGEEPIKAEDACTLDGHLTIGKVSANFHVEVSESLAAAKAGRGQMHTIPNAVNTALFSMEHRRTLNISHKIHSLHFGERIHEDMVAPLDGVVNSPPVAGQQQYLLKVIPTVVKKKWGSVKNAIATNQYSLAEQFVRFDSLPLLPYVKSVQFFFFHSYN
uniref:Endoplasmic reticulum vesicle transporter N-terminal domain-containing protein n=1 Tax=Aureoumbra lagunensis TaxID=44058 RepID=A0A7S3JU50_9STRA|mmetsp:Transcript_17100/g.22172  ORF Transcript_17100/g.22172 Transcript_17100/m.22172 type:complete len:281 (+) Transcript_17100:32-874(+)